MPSGLIAIAREPMNGPGTLERAGDAAACCCGPERSTRQPLLPGSWARRPRRFRLAAACFALDAAKALKAKQQGEPVRPASTGSAAGEGSLSEGRVHAGRAVCRPADTTTANACSPSGCRARRSGSRARDRWRCRRCCPAAAGRPPRARAGRRGRWRCRRAGGARPGGPSPRTGGGVIVSVHSTALPPWSSVPQGEVVLAWPTVLEAALVGLFVGCGGRCRSGLTVAQASWR